MGSYRYCVSKTISVAMKIERWDYGLHGHDIEVTACWSADKPVDLEYLDSILTKTLSSIDHKPLWETVGGGGIIEDLLTYLCNNTSLYVKGAELVKITGRMLNKRVDYYCSNS